MSRNLQKLHLETPPLKQLTAAKLFRPEPTSDFVVRQGIFNKLDQAEQHNLTLISAPAGYGKSVTVSGWLDTCSRPYAWLSLSNSDDNLLIFFQYFIAAIEGIFPDSCSKTSTFLLSTQNVAAEKLAEVLTEDLSALPESIIVVIDDMGFIRKTEIFTVLDTVINFCPRTLQLVLTTRRDPPLSLQILQLRGKLTEVRQEDFKFQSDEAIEFFQKSKSISLTSHQTALILEKIEGWPAGLRLLVLSIAGGVSVDEFIREIKGDSRDFREYLLSEVLNQQTPRIRNALLRTSILRKFTSELCDHFCDDDLSGFSFVSHLNLSNLFCISVDFGMKWFRYHHLFRDLLFLMLERRYNDEEIDELHRQAAKWHDDHGDLEEAIYHYLEINDENSAIRVLENHRHDLMNNERWRRLDYLMHLLPEDSFYHSPGILVAKAFLAENRFMIGKALDYTQKLEKLCSNTDSGEIITDAILAEKDALLSLKYYFANDPVNSVKYGLRAIEHLPENSASVRGFAQGLSAFSWQMQGKIKNALNQLSKALNRQDIANPTLRGRLLLTYCFIYWFEGDLKNLQNVASRFEAFAKKQHLQEAYCFAKYFLGIVAYQNNDLEQAELHLEEGLEKGRNINITADAHNTFTLALTKQAKGNEGKAMELAEQVVKSAFDLGNSDLLTIAQAFRVELALRQGRKRVVEQWFKQHRQLPVFPVYRMYSPYITEIRASMIQNGSALQKAYERTSELIAFFCRTHQTPMLIELYSVSARQAEINGRNEEADNFLYQALALASPGRFINVFRSMGQSFPAMLERQLKSDINQEYLDLLSRNFDVDGNQNGSETESGRTDGAVGLFSQQPLSDRELQILTFFSKRLSNKEIASELFISVNTVKRHAINIYQKLEVHTRREAVLKAQNIGLLS